MSTDGLAGSSVSRMMPCDSAAEYPRVPSSLKVMSCDSVPSPGRGGSATSAIFFGRSSVRMSNTSIAGWNEVIRSEFEL